jgi:PEGA domain
MTEIRKVPPRLVGYSVAAAAAFILIIIVGMWLHFHRQTADSTPATDITATSTEETPATQPDAIATPVPQVETGNEPQVTVTPQYPQPKRRAIAKSPVPPAIMPGQLTITSVPEGAQVQVDGRTDPNWLTPYTVTGLKPGSHSISLAKSGYSSDSKTVSITAGARSALEMRLAQLGATVTVASQPAGAAVYIDGKSTGHVTPAHITVTERGTHTIVVRKDGYLDETTTTALTPGLTFNFAPVLRAMGVTDDIKVVGKFNKLFGKKGAAGMGRLSIKTQPKGAQVTANRRMVDKPTPVDFLLNPGNYEVEITLPGYKRIHRIVNVDEGTKVELNENLQPE